MSAAKKEKIDLSPGSVKEHVEADRIGINMLNDDCLMRIMQYLPIVDRVRIERVCKRWQTVSLDAWRGFKNLDFKNKCWGFNKPQKLADVNHGVVKKLLKRCGKFLILIEFNPFYREELGPNVLESVARFCPNIQHLNAGRLCISAGSWIALAVNCNKLVSFSVRKCRDDELSLLLENNKQLRRLCVFDSRLTGKCLRKLNCDSIELIQFDNCSLNLKHFQVIRNFHKLKQLIIQDIELDNDFMEIISSCYKSLKYLSLPFHFENYGNFQQQVAKLINLRELDLLADAFVNDELLASVGANCKLLKKVDISCCDAVTNTGLASIVFLPNLESLLFSELKNINDQVFRAMPTLREMNCSECTHVRDAGLIKLIEGSENLEHLYLHDCEKISNKVLEADIKAMKKRKNQVMLKLHLSDEDVERLEARDTSPFLPIFWTIIDRSPHINYSQEQPWGRFPVL